MHHINRFAQRLYINLRFDLAYYFTSRYVLVYLPVFAIAAIIFAFVLREYLSLNSPDPSYWRVGAVSATLMLVLGWIVSAEISIRNSKTQHTIDLVTEYLNNSSHAKAQKIIRKYLKTTYAVLTAKISDFDKINELTDAIKRELNLLEFLCAAYRSHTLDRTLLEDGLRLVITFQFSRFRLFVEHHQKIFPDVWIHLSAVNKHLHRSSNPLDDLTSTLIAGFALTFIIWFALDYLIF